MFSRVGGSFFPRNTYFAAVKFFSTTRKNYKFFFFQKTEKSFFFVASGAVFRAVKDD